MIQRIQTLYLLFVVILGTLLCFFSPVQFLAQGSTEYISLMAFDKWPLAVITLVIPLLALVNIFLFKRRLLQVRLNIMNVIFCLGYYALLALYIAFAVKGYEQIGDTTLANAEWYLNVWTAFPLVNLVLTMMATRRILKDEALVRAADRLR
jgi:hypothetical protein